MQQEGTIIEGLRKGDRDTFRDLVNTWQVKVINLSNAYLNDLEEAEDIAQDVFLEVLESIHRFRGDSSLATWIYRITVNKSLNRRKKLRRQSLFRIRQQQLSSREIVSLEQKHTVPDPQSVMQQQEDRIALSRAIDRLPEQQRNAFILYQYEQMSYKEIADVLKVSLPAVESLLFRAKSNMRKYLISYITE
ncbi:MAG TPA: RNA polymerase sigma factor [Bacteroidales bacterium]|nr:RNA polymerase sigma factor [Bacteroidales bacterium]HRZ50127.1 RNA polymerase sigma factor [Bacteroidales bacterium]